AERELDVPAALAALAAAGRVLELEIGGPASRRARWVAVEDAARYSDGLGVALPEGVPAALLQAGDEDALTGLVARWARTHGPFTPEEIATRWGLPRGAVAAVLDALVARGTLVRGALRPGGADDEWCDADVMRKLRRRTLAHLRQQV